MTVIQNWIEQAAARHGEAHYLEDAASPGTLPSPPRTTIENALAVSGPTL